MINMHIYIMEFARNFLNLVSMNFMVLYLKNLIMIFLKNKMMLSLRNFIITLSVILKNLKNLIWIFIWGWKKFNLNLWLLAYTERTFLEERNFFINLILMRFYLLSNLYLRLLLNFFDNTKPDFIIMQKLVKILLIYCCFILRNQLILILGCLQKQD